MSVKVLTYAEATKLGANVAAAMLRKKANFTLAINTAAKKYPQAGAAAIRAEINSRAAAKRAHLAATKLATAG